MTSRTYVESNGRDTRILLRRSLARGLVLTVKIKKGIEIGGDPVGVGLSITD